MEEYTSVDQVGNPVNAIQLTMSTIQKVQRTTESHSRQQPLDIRTLQKSTYIVFLGLSSVDNRVLGSS